jgi:hypothetical protein
MYQMSDFTSALAQSHKRALEEVNSGPSLLTTTVIIAGVLSLKRKSDLKEKVKTLLTELQIAGLNVKFIRCDNAGENVSMKSDQDIKSFGVKFEFSGPRTSQRN